MIVNTLWVWRKTDDGPDLLVAWDEFSVEQNYPGWELACAAALKAVKDEIGPLGYRYIDLKFDGHAIEQAFYPPEVEAEVTVP